MNIILRAFLVGAILIRCLGTVNTVAVAQDARCGEWDWAILQTSDVAFWYPRQYGVIAIEIVEALGASLSAKIDNVEAVFGISEPLNFIIRLYPDELVYSCLNVAVGPLSNQMMAAVGDGELAIIASKLDSDSQITQPRIEERVQGALLQLAANRITEDSLPPGIGVGIGGYGVPPASLLDATPTDHALDDTDLRFLLNQTPELAIQPSYEIQMTSFVAYMIDVFGWGNFVDWLRAFGGGLSLDAAVSSVYNLTLRELEREWRDYRALYLGGRNEENLFYSVDLEAIETLIEEGGYSVAVQQLTEKLPFIARFGSASEARAVGLLDAATSGQRAQELSVLARQALLAGSHEESLRFAQQAAAIYGDLGNQAKTEELRAFLEWSSEVLELRAEALYLAKQTGPLGLLATPRLIYIQSRLAELGDHASAESLDKVILQLAVSQSGLVELTQAVIAMLTFFLLGSTVRQFARNAAKEARRF